MASGVPFKHASGVRFPTSVPMKSETFYLYLFGLLYGTFLTLMAVWGMMLFLEWIVFCSHQLVA